MRVAQLVGDFAWSVGHDPAFGVNGETVLTWPQVQLGDREVADSAPEDGEPEQRTQRGGPQSLELPAHPSLLHLQQHQMQQSMQPHLVNSSEMHSAPLSNSANLRGVSRINSLGSLSSEYLRASERESSNQAQHSAGMTYWGAPQGGVASTGNPGDSSRGYSAPMGHMGQSAGQPHGSYGAGLPRGNLLGGPPMHSSAPLGTAPSDTRRMPLVRKRHD